MQNSDKIMSAFSHQINFIVTQFFEKVESVFLRICSCFLIPNGCGNYALCETYPALFRRDRTRELQVQYAEWPRSRKNASLSHS